MGQVRLGANSLNPDGAFQWNYGSGFSLSELIAEGNVYLSDSGFVSVFNTDANQFASTAIKDTGISSSWNLTDNLVFNLGYTVDGDDSRNPEIGIFTNFNLVTSIDFLGDHFDAGVGFSLSEGGN